MISNIGTTNVYSSSFDTISHNAGAKLEVPVNPMYVVYSQLEHVSGVAAEKNQEGVNINKVQILNTLIDHLTTVRSHKDRPNPVTAEMFENPSQIDKMIQDYQSQIHSAIKMSEINPFTPNPALLQTGAIFNFTV